MEQEKKVFRKIKDSDLEMIMNWRMQPDITKYMFTDPQLTLEKQIQWYEKISKEDDSFYWIFEVNGLPVGLVSLVDWDKKNSVIYGGGYIAEKKGRTLNNILDMNMNLYRYAFEELKINKAAIEIMSNNVSQVQWMKRIGAVQEGIARQAIKKNGQYYDLYLLSFLKEEWENVCRKNKYNIFEIEQLK